MGSREIGTNKTRHRDAGKRGEHGFSLVGIWILVHGEEKLLRDRFDAAYSDYATRVTRFLPDRLTACAFALARRSSSLPGAGVLGR